MVTITSKVYDGLCWHVFASVSLPNGVWVGPHMIEAGEDATDEQIAAALVQMYVGMT